MSYYTFANLIIWTLVSIPLVGAVILNRYYAHYTSLPIETPLLFYFNAGLVPIAFCYLLALLARQAQRPAVTVGLLLLGAGVLVYAYNDNGPCAVGNCNDFPYFEPRIAVIKFLDGNADLYGMSPDPTEPSSSLPIRVVADMPGSWVVLQDQRTSQSAEIKHDLVRIDYR